jgi:hypothetical protein
MSSYRVEQRRLVYRGREFHFVSYEGRPANQHRGEAAIAPMWYLMSAGKRVPVMPYLLGQPATDVDRGLLAWVHAQGL